MSTFSKTLAFLFGLFVFSVQVCYSFAPAFSSTKLTAVPYCSKFAASRGYNIIPTTRLQKYVKSIDLRSALEDNVAFKLSFGATFMLAAFAEL